MSDTIASVSETKSVSKPSANKKAITSTVKTIEVVKEEKPQTDWEQILADVGDGTSVKHKLFGEGTISKMDKAKKYIHVKFKKGEKQFIFPDAFIAEFLSLK